MMAETATNDTAIDKTPGEILSVTREAQGLLMEDVAQRLRLPLRIIKAMEENDFEMGINLAFFRGYLRNYARLLGLPEKPVDMAFSALNIQWLFIRNGNVGSSCGGSINIRWRRRIDSLRRGRRCVSVRFRCIINLRWLCANSFRGINYLMLFHNGHTL